jgi:hypothetical protein
MSRFEWLAFLPRIRKITDSIPGKGLVILFVVMLAAFQQIVVF